MTRVLFIWEKRPATAVAGSKRDLVRRTVEPLLASPAEVHILMTDDARIRELNQRYRTIDEPTDVLSFADGSTLPTGMTLLGQIVVSLDTARRQAAEMGHSEARELHELVLHGVLHLLGHDHTTDDGEMDALENELRGELIR